MIVAGGVLRYAAHEFQELGWLPGEQAVVIDVSSTIAADSVLGTMIRGLVNLTPTMTWLEVIILLAYVVPTLILFFWVIVCKGKSSQPTVTAQISEDVPAEVSR